MIKYIAMLYTYEPIQIPFHIMHIMTVSHYEKMNHIMIHNANPLKRTLNMNLTVSRHSE